MVASCQRPIITQEGALPHSWPSATSTVTAGSTSLWQTRSRTWSRYRSGTATERSALPPLMARAAPDHNSLAIGDLNSDGNPDLVVANLFSSRVSVLLGNGDGSFGVHTDYGAGDPFSLAIGDLNADGKPDVVTANWISNTVSVLLGNGDGSFGVKNDYPTSYVPQSVAIGDLNGDGKPDLALAANP